MAENTEKESREGCVTLESVRSQASLVGEHVSSSTKIEKRDPGPLLPRSKQESIRALFKRGTPHIAPAAFGKAGDDEEEIVELCAPPVRLLSENPLAPFDSGQTHSEAVKLFEEHVGDVDNDDSDPLLPRTQALQPHKAKWIDTIKAQLDSVPMPELYSFDQAVHDDTVMIGTLSVEEVAEREQIIEKERIKVALAEAEVHQLRQEEIMAREREARLRLAAEARNAKEELDRIKKERRVKESLRAEKTNRAFRIAEDQLKYALAERKGAVQSEIGELSTVGERYTGIKGRRYRVEWYRTPQPVQIRLEMLRAVKDKLPRGRYVVLVTMFERLGGDVLHWTNLKEGKGKRWTGATVPTRHEGRYHDIELAINQSVYTVCPAKPDMTPSMCFVFEIYQLKGHNSHGDQVVAWGAFPMYDMRFEIVKGKFKIPLLRGPVDPEVDTYKGIEGAYMKDLDHWLCNLYFEIIHLPRYLAGQKEYEVELQYTSELLGNPDREESDEEMGLLADQDSDHDSECTTNPPSLAVSRQPSDDITTSTTKQVTFADAVQRLEDQERQSHSMDFAPVPREDDDEGRRKAEKKRASTVQRLRRRRRKMTSKLGVKQRVYELDPEVIEIMDRPPKTPIFKKDRHHASKPTHAQLLERYEYGLPPIKGRFSRASRKLAFINREIYSHLGLHNRKSLEFWTTISFFVIAFWLRLYAHYIGEWLFLQMLRVPVTRFVFLPYSVDVIYNGGVLPASYEVGVVFSGMTFCIGLLLLCVLLVWASLTLLGCFPDPGYQFVLCFGAVVSLDPFLVLLVDLMRGNMDGDAFKLWNKYEEDEDSGVPGLFITAVVYVVLIALSCLILYHYIMKIHKNGRMMDLHYRLTRDSDAFFLPYDLEISTRQMRYITRKAERWRGENGSRRKIGVCDFVLTDENDSDFKEVITHMGIYTLSMDGTRELHRHFIRLPDGALFEVFGDLDIMGSTEYSALKRVLLNASGTVEEFLHKGTQAHPVTEEEPDILIVNVNEEEEDDVV